MTCCLIWVRKPLLFSLSTWLFLACVWRTSVAQTPPEAVLRPLEPGQPLERELAGNGKHAYQLSLSAGQYLHLIVDQRGIDVLLTLFAPDGKKLVEVDSAYPDGGQGPEPLFWVTESAGEHRLEISPLDTKAALGRYEVKIVTLRTATETDRTRTRANIAQAEGERLFDENKPDSYRQAVEQYKVAAPLFRELGELVREAGIHFKLGAAYSVLGERPLALDHYNEAVRLFREGKDRAREATTLNMVAAIYNTLGEKDKAKALLTKALKLWREEKNRPGEALTLNSLGAVYRDLGERQKALQHYLLSLQIRRELKDKAGEAATLHNLGVLYDDLGEVQKMLDTHTQALPLRRDPVGRVLTLNSIGRGYDRLGLPHEAINYYQQSLALTRSSANKFGEARTLNLMGLAYWSLGEYQTALSYLNQALPFFREGKNHLDEATTLNNLGFVYNSLNEPAQALRFYQQALPLFRTVKDRQAEASLLHLIGFAYERLGDNSSALDYQQRSLKLSREVGDPRRVAKAHYGLARLERAQGRLKQAREHIEQAIRIVESLRAKLDSPELRAAYRASTAQYYEFYIDLLMRMRKQTGRAMFVGLALQASEQARARSLLELLQEAGAEIRSDAAPELVAREQELQQQLSDKTAQLLLLTDANTATPTTALAAEVDSLTATLRDVQSQLRRASPRYAALTQPQPLSVREIQQQVLDRQTMLLEYSLGEECSYLWAVTKDSITSYELPRRAEIEKLARQYYELLTDPSQQERITRPQRGLRTAKGESENFTQLATTLSRMLLAPVAHRLGQQRLLIVADGALQYVPFASLPVVRRPLSVAKSQAKNNGQRTTDDGQPLILKHEIITAPSASTLAVLRRDMTGAQKATKEIAVIADPVFDTQDERVKTISVGAGNKVLAATAPAPDPSRLLLLKLTKAAGKTDVEARIPRLPNTRREAEAILSLVNANSRYAAFDFAANRSAAINVELGQYRILHFATHGFLNATNPQLSGLVLSLVDEKGTAQNGFLLAPEIYQLKLAATELVVLSACQTGLGQEVKGEGVIGLTRGFMYAGAPRVVVSLWNVSDEATADLMKLFYEALLKQKLRPAAALRAAQVGLWKQARWRAPYYWAAFGLQGEWR